MLRILIVDDHPIMRRGIRSLLELHPGWEVCGEASNGWEALAMSARLRPDVCIVDVSMADLNGIETTRRIRAALPATEVLVLTVHESEELADALLAAGARGYVLKADVADDLTSAVEALARHEPFLTRKLRDTAVERLRRSPPSPRTGIAGLTRREREIVQLIAEGHRTHRIGALLGITEKTVESHRAAILRKLRLRSVAEVVRFAIRNGLVEP